MSNKPGLVVKTRFCPSPTGKVHLGNIRTALINALYARHHQGDFLLRIEDTDQERSQSIYTDLLREDLLWLGLVWNEGPQQVGEQGQGDNGPYWQSQRGDFYEKYYQQLESKDVVYPCFCSEQTLAIARKAQLAAGRPPRYSGACKKLSKEDIDAKIAAGEKPVLRFKIPSDEKIKFNDLVRGEQCFISDDLGDFIVRRSNGTPPFMFCNAVDDAAMGVTHALRGEDHLTNTPRQLLILQALGLPAPTYGHISLIVGDDGSPLSKRHGSKDIGSLKDEGYLPLALVNYMARLGHHYTEHQEQLMSLQTLSERFNEHGLATSPARYDETQLHHWQHLAVQALTSEELQTWAKASLAAVPAEVDQTAFLAAIRDNITFPQDIANWAANLFTAETDFNFSSAEKTIISAATVDFYQQAKQLIEKNPADWAALTAGLKAACAVKGKALFQPLRLALTGCLDGPAMGPLLSIIPTEVIIKRLQQAENIAAK